MATTTRKKTEDVLAAARKDLQAQLALVHDEMSRLAAEEQALTQALSTLDTNGASSSTRAPAAKPSGESRTARTSTRRSSARKAGATRRRRRGASKSTADRVNELRGLLADGPKSRNDLAAALKVSPARVQQLLAELGSSVSSRRDPDQRQGKLWALTDGNRASAATPTRRRSGGRAQDASTRKPAAGRKEAAK